MYLHNAVLYSLSFQSGCTLLYIALKKGHTQVVELLLSKGAYVNSVNKVSTSIDYSIYIELCHYHCSQVTLHYILQQRMVTHK